MQIYATKIEKLAILFFVLFFLLLSVLPAATCLNMCYMNIVAGDIRNFGLLTAENVT